MLEEVRGGSFDPTAAGICGGRASALILRGSLEKRQQTNSLGVACYGHGTVHSMADWPAASSALG